MARIRLQFADSQDNRSYLNDTDYLLLNAFIETGSHGSSIVKRPGFKFKKVVSATDTNARGMVYSSQHDLLYVVISDALFSVSANLNTVTELVRKTPISATWSAAAGGTFTYVFAAAHGFVATQQVSISGITPTGYSGVKTVAAVSTTTVADDTFTVTGVGADPGAATLTTARVSPIITSSGKVYFEQTKSSTVMNMMLQIPKTASTASQLFMIASGGTVTRVTSANWPVDTIGPVVSIDGYLFGLSSARSEICNMDLEAPTTMTSSLAFVSADTYADNAIALAKHHNQVVCLKEYSTEFFYDAAIAAPASPLAKIPQQTIIIGCVNAATVVQTGNRLIWVSRNQNGGLAVHMMTGGSLNKVSNVFIDRILASLESFIVGNLVDSFYVSFEGHEFYVLSVEGVTGTNQGIFGIGVFGTAIFGLGAGLNSYKRTLVYDMTENKWSEWSSIDPDTGQPSSFFASHATSGPHASSSQDYSNMIIMSKTSGDIYEMSPPPLGTSYGATYKDGTSAITVKIVTNNMDGGTRNLKKMNSLEIVGDTNRNASTLSIRATDDDYQTWSTARTVDLTGRTKSFNWGSFRQRAFEFTHSDDTPLRLDNVEVDVIQMVR